MLKIELNFPGVAYLPEALCCGWFVNPLLGFHGRCPKVFLTLMLCWKSSTFTAAQLVAIPTTHTLAREWAIRSTPFYCDSFCFSKNQLLRLFVTTRQTHPDPLLDRVHIPPLHISVHGTRSCMFRLAFPSIHCLTAPAARDWFPWISEALTQNDFYVRAWPCPRSLPRDSFSKKPIRHKLSFKRFSRIKFWIVVENHP